jgi:hypothetical protein
VKDTNTSPVYRISKKRLIKWDEDKESWRKFYQIEEKETVRTRSGFASLLVMGGIFFMFISLLFATLTNDYDALLVVAFFMVVAVIGMSDIFTKESTEWTTHKISFRTKKGALEYIEGLKNKKCQIQK